MQKSIYQFFFFVHSLSIDIALGACAMLYSIHHLFFFNHRPPSPFQFIILFLSTLIVYWIDHLQDSKNSLLVRPGKRHGIFKRNKNVFRFLLMVFIAVNAYLSLKYLFPLQIIGGLLLCLGMGIYLFNHAKFKRKIILEKEILIGVLYTLSVFYFPYTNLLVQSNDWYVLLRPDQFLILSLLFMSVFLTALQNLFSMAIIEEEAEQLANVRSIASLFGSNRLMHLQKLMLLLQLLTGVILALFSSSPALPHFLLILLVITIINFILPFLFSSTALVWYRIIGDSCFLLAFFI